MIDIKAVSPGESVTEVILSRWFKPNGSWVQKDEKIAEIESDKAALEVYAEASGRLEVLVPEGSTVPVGQVIARIDPQAAPENGSPAPEPLQKVAALPDSGPKVSEAPVRREAPAHVMPSAARILAEKGLSPEEVPATGPGGRLTKADALSAPAKTPTPPPAEAPIASPPMVVPDALTAAPSADRTEIRKKLSPIRQTIARRLLAAKNQTAMLTTFNEVDMSRILEIRKAYKDRFQEKHGIGLGFMSFFTKACAQALLEFPEVNSQLHDDELVYFNYVDISVAVSTDRGLVVPVVRNAHVLSLADIERVIADLATRARQNKISIEEMQGGTFTITNGGVFGSLLSTPILNPPQTAILGMHKVQERPMAIGGQVQVRPMMYVALSYDHRVIDGKEAVSFLVRVKELLEDPMRLLLAV